MQTNIMPRIAYTRVNVGSSISLTTAGLSDASDESEPICSAQTPLINSISIMQIKSEAKCFLMFLPP